MDRLDGEDDYFLDERDDLDDPEDGDLDQSDNAQIEDNLEEEPIDGEPEGDQLLGQEDNFDGDLYDDPSENVNDLTDDMNNDIHEPNMDVEPGEQEQQIENFEPEDIPDSAEMEHILDSDANQLSEMGMDAYEEAPEMEADTDLEADGDYNMDAEPSPEDNLDLTPDNMEDIPDADVAEDMGDMDIDAIAEEGADLEEIIAMIV